MAFVRVLTTLLRDKDMGPHVVPIVPDESRTFGMEGLFRQVGIFSQVGQLYRPQDADQLMYYREDPKGQILQEGINEPGAMASFIAAGTSYSTSNVPMVPFYIYYSMFGFQRVGDLAWAAGDMRTRGFLIGGTSGRTTLNGEGLQHEDGHSHILASTIPNCVDLRPDLRLRTRGDRPAGLKRMLVDQDDVYYYITTLNENYAHPAMPEGAEEGILSGAYKLREVKADRPRIAGAAARRRRDPARGRGGGGHAGQRARRLQRNLERDQLHRIASRGSRRRTVEPAASGVRRQVSIHHAGAVEGKGPVIASTDYMKAIATASGLTCLRATRCSEPTASGAPTIAAGCARSSRSTAITSRSRA